ncbi:hypothetical protein IEQ34_023846 [Dendrobium chrysotoxum]|uniref:Uncharacterized protein n=1 Tax=Dendrobium chrysotoxum TaxID=161865 RepID=A0AAV7FTK0_DENCH|nr:hypothetical protein IEQ34_023846 [Dendrobium chrysotoxum]
MGLQEDERIRNCIKDYVKKKEENILRFRRNCPYRNSKRIDLIQLLNELNKRVQKEFKCKLQGVSTEKRLHVSNGSEKAGSLQNNSR